MHVNRLRRFSDGATETNDPNDGVYPDTRRIFKGITGTRTKDGIREFKIKALFQVPVSWIKESDLPELVVKEYDKIKQVNETSVGEF